MQHSKNSTKNEFGLSEEVNTLLRAAFSKFPKIEKVKIFGSRANSNYSNGSDIDLAFFASNFSHDEFLDLKLAIDKLNLLYKTDVINYQKIKSKALKAHIDQYGRKFYETVSIKKMNKSN